MPYRRRLVLVVLISIASTGLTLSLPLLSRDFFDRALVGRDAPYLFRIAVAFAGATALSFVLNVISGLRYTRVSADILFDMRLEMYRHLQRLSPRFYARICGWATSCRASTATSAKSSAWLPRRRLRGWATDCFLLARR